MPPSAPLAAILGCSGPDLTPDERRFFRDADPLGFILFARNVVDPPQLRRLVTALRESVGRAAPVLIDQEGGRVQRLRPPHWRAYPPAAVLGARGLAPAAEAARAQGEAIGRELAALGIDVDCAPVADLHRAETHAAIGDRAFAGDPHAVATLALAFALGLLAGGAMPVVKHLPGQGRARADSHLELPVIDAPVAELAASDWAVFRALSALPWAMTAHVVVTALDPGRPATQSPIVIGTAIRGAIGFDGFLLSDDLCMAALTGGPGARATAAIAAGCDAVLHCNGALAEMQAVAAAVGPLAARALAALERGRALAARHLSTAQDAADPFARLTRLLAA